MTQLATEFECIDASCSLGVSKRWAGMADTAILFMKWLESGPVLHSWTHLRPGSDYFYWVATNSVLREDYMPDLRLTSLAKSARESQR